MRRMLIAFAVVLLAAVGAHGQVIIDNFGAGDTYNTAIGANVSALFNVGVRVLPSANAYATDVYVAMKSTSSSNITLSICVDANGHPGALVDPSATATIVVAAADPQVYHTMFQNPPALAAGTTYWLKAAGGAAATWMLNSTGQTGFASTSGTGSWNTNNNATPAFRVSDFSIPPLGACCSGSTCSVGALTACNAVNSRFAGIGVSCNAAGNNTTPCCRADFNQNGSLSVQDIFDYLAAWFGGNGQADINGSGLAVQDLFDLLSAWFAGC